jgi:hypothetical protein
MPALGGWVPFAACVAAAAVLVAVGARRVGWRLVALAAVPVIVVVEAVAAIASYWPTGNPDDLYAPTATSDFLQTHVGSDRYASAYSTLFVNSNRVFGLRTVTGRGFYEDEWGDLIDEINDAQVGIRTLSVIDPLPADRVQSPVLDRLAVRYYMTNPVQPVYGEPEPLEGRPGRFELQPGEPAVVDVAGPVRAIGLELAEDPDVGGERPRLKAELLDADGTVLSTGWWRMYDWVEAGPWHMAVPGDRADDAVAARLTLVDAERPLALTGVGGGPAAFVVRPAPDGLRLVHSEETVIYERMTALPRIRWASDAEVESDRERRVETVDDPGVPSSTVVLSEPGPQPTGEATVDVLEDAGERIRVRVDAAGAGYVVVADALQRGWRAEVDGQATDLVDADHALVAVAVPEGDHQVTLEYDPPGQRAGLLISFLSALVLVTIGMWSVRRRRASEISR